MKLRPDQERGVADVRAAFAQGHRRVCYVSPTGSGKTVCSAHMIMLAVARGRRCAFFSRRLELNEQCAATLRACGVDDVRVIQGERDNGTGRVVVASIPTLVTDRWIDNLPDADFVVWDECFPAGTLVDGRPIEALRVGDLVRSFNHMAGRVERRAIKRLFVSQPNMLVTVHLTDGRAITCTAGHPFFVGDNYVAAMLLRAGDPIYGESFHMRGVHDDVRAPGLDQGDGGEPGMRRGVQEDSERTPREENRNNVCNVRNRDRSGGSCRSTAGTERSGVLLAGVQQGVPTKDLGSDACGNEPSLRFGTNEGDQSDALGSDSRARERRAQGNGTSATDSGRQRTRPRADGDAVAQRPVTRLDTEPRRENEHAAKHGLSGKLQTGPCLPRDEDRDRGRWIEPLRARQQGEGRKEAGVSRVARVDRVEVHKPAGEGGFGSLCPDGLVYNVEVDGNHNYFVDGVLVHNCHGIKARTNLELANKYSRAHHLGLTATPARGDGQPLSDAFDAIVVGATVAELTQLGLLVPCRVYAPPCIMSPRELAMEPVDAYERHCAGRRCVVFATTIKHAVMLADAFKARGHRAANVDGDMAERSDVIAAYAAGEIDVLVNVNLLIEGWDDKPTSAAIFARRFTHPGPYLQAIGRTLRTSPGKSDAVVVDLCGSALVHGTPDVEREYSLSGKAISKADRLAIRQCAACGGVSTGRSECPYCSAQFPIAMRGIPKAGDIGVSEVPKTKPTSWPMRAKKTGLCAQCGRQILPGTWIVYSKLRRIAVHTGCSGAWSQAVAA